MEEIWKTIEEYPDYMISSMGRVRSLDREILNRWGNNYRLIKGKILKPALDRYLRVSLSKNGKSKTFTIHKLVAKHFIPNPNNLSEIDHINTDKTDNRVENLRWVTHRENQNNTVTKSKMKLNKSKSKPIIQFSLDGEFIKRWNSCSDIKRELGYNQCSISACCRNMKSYHTAYGYIWGFEKDYEIIPFKIFDLKIYKKIA